MNDGMKKERTGFLRRTLLFGSAWLATSAALWGAPVRYKDNVFTSATVTSNIQYGSSKTFSGGTENLLMDVYRPQGDTAKLRPLFIFVHGGGFSGGGKTDGDIVYLCQTFAKKGYVTASFGYRLQQNANTFQVMNTEVFRAVQDGKAAVRFLRAHRAEYGIDDTRILMGGTSAGGALSLEYAYLDPQEIPSFIDTNALGGLDGSGGTPGVSSAINGVVNCWGGVSDSTWVKNGKLPVIHFHGTADPTVPFDAGYALGNPALIVYGSACLHRGLIRAGVHSILKPFVGMGHGMSVPGDPRADTLVAMTRDFAYDVLFPSNPTVILPSRRLIRMETVTEPANGMRFFQVDGRTFGRIPMTVSTGNALAGAPP